MTTKESITASLEDVDSLINKLYSLVSPIRIEVALENHSGPYAAVLKTIEGLDNGTRSLTAKEGIATT
jgi:hypothetical protein